MTTKDQERKALEEIKAIVEKVGGDQSYIGMAFKGCFEIAEDNIANDFGDSWMDRWSSIVDENNTARDRIAAMQRIENENNKTIEWLSDKVRALEANLEEYRTKSDGLFEKGEQHRIKALQAQDKADRLEDENTKLKAKLYDMMTA